MSLCIHISVYHILSVYLVIDINVIAYLFTICADILCTIILFFTILFITCLSCLIKQRFHNQYPITRVQAPNVKIALSIRMQLLVLKHHPFL